PVPSYSLSLHDALPISYGPTSVSFGVRAPVVADFDGDGAADLVVAAESASIRPMLFFGRGDGVFDAVATTLDVDAVVGSIATSTGNAIVAVRANALQLITVMAGRSLQTQQIYAAPPNSHFFIVSD